MSKQPPKVLNSFSTTPLPARDKKWHEHVTIDVFLAVLNRTILHPFVAWILVLCLRAQVTPLTDTAFILATGWAVLLTLLAAARMMNQRIAYGIPRPVDLNEEVVVVTGGASGLGRLIAQVYGMRGVSVAVLDVREALDVDELAGVEYYRCDIGDRKEVEATRLKIEKDLGTPTILINCAAARINGEPLLSLPAEAFQKTIQTNLLSVFHLCQVFLPGMLSAANGGTIVTVSSVLGHLSAAGLSDYAASKAGLSALHRTLEAELRTIAEDDMVKMLLVEIGQMSTPLFDWVKTPNRFFAPVLEPVQVAQAIVNAIDSGKGGVIRLPFFATWISWYTVLPASVQLIARYLSGIDNAVVNRSAKTQAPAGTGEPNETSEKESGGIDSD
ncbi:hypothetical protein ASPZODRAFT_63093 [Penicilliopsis zonata CBS 506.65]|uniref:Uncharacterized protein n=1 Tax=Penicilliopsis zonata CBS 506.65 TaxID=1073090 RepID=A0A1L9SK44_9EURO|nr:hypothetical protein ASPZODRAFT_63093 [Penicilliopsis zonata CBS 506.65]OJJ47578.1 hypothetical protein ASPZODRAFT_63093 [Penicilliopsis zonata CBS 506.65]